MCWRSVICLGNALVGFGMQTCVGCLCLGAMEMRRPHTRDKSKSKLKKNRSKESNA